MTLIVTSEISPNDVLETKQIIGRSSLQVIFNMFDKILRLLATILQAIVRTLETAPFSQRPLMIKTDSMYSIQCMTC